MSMQDPIADMLTRIRNAQAVKKPFIILPLSNLKLRIAKLLVKEGYVSACRELEESTKPGGELKIALKYDENEHPVIDFMKRVSKPSLRVYKAAKDLPLVESGLGTAVVSTSKGVMTAKSARRLSLGGEVLFFVS